MKALLKIEWIKTWRSWPVFIMSIGMPVGFFPVSYTHLTLPTNSRVDICVGGV